jgi:two-component system sensor histidine kinase ChvG
MFNVLLVFLPIASFLYLDTYEQQLLQSLEHALVQQGRVLASALSERGSLEPDEAQHILRQLKQQHEARMRVVDHNGKLVSDSAILGPRKEDLTVSTDASEEEDTREDARSSFLYRLASFPIRLFRRFFRPPTPPLEIDEFYLNSGILLGSEVREALKGRYGAVTRISSGGQRSVTLYSAIPIWNAERVIGAVLISQSTYRILRDLYVLRLEVFRIFLISITAAVIISLLLSITIARPLRRLQYQARKILDHRGRLQGHFILCRQPDEIGALSQALQELTLALERHIRFIESFASDVSHEFKNPLASIRSATEIALQADNPEDSTRFLDIIQREVVRMEHLLSGVREISLIDSRLEEEDRQHVDVADLANLIVEAFRFRDNPKQIKFVVQSPPDEEIKVFLSPERLTQVLENLLDNAVSFSPSRGLVELSISKQEEQAVICVVDRGPGIPSQHMEKIFDRFFSFRPAGTRKENHSGLGLAIVRALVEGYGGSITVLNDDSGGACFKIKLPLSCT